MRAAAALGTTLALLALCPIAWAGSGENGSAKTTGQVAGQTLPKPSPIAPEIFRITQLDRPPPGFKVTARRAIRVAEATPTVRSAKASHRNLHPEAYVSPNELPQGFFYHWDIYFVDAQGVPQAEVELNAFNADVLQTASGVDVGWPLVRGYPGVLGNKLNAPYVWLPLCLLFLAPFFDWRRPFRLLHFDLLAILAFGASQLAFTAGNPDLSVPLVYPVLAWLAVRLLIAAFRPVQRQGPLVPLLSNGALLLLLIVLVALRIGYSVQYSQTFDISYAGVVGADRIEHGQEIYVDNDLHPDTYGPVNYYAYIPFELVLPYHGQTSSTDLPAARAATIGFDALTILGLLVLGTRLVRGPPGRRLGLALAVAWAACPYTTLLFAGNTNDGLIPLFTVWALVAIRSPVGRGALIALGTMAKFVPALVAPAFAAGQRWRTRDVVVYAITFVVVVVATLLPLLPPGGLHVFWNTTLGFQLHRTSPLSLWDRHPGLDWLQTILKVCLALLILVSAFRPRQRTTGQIAALSGAIIVMSQMVTSYWIYFYVVWFVPMLLIAVFTEYADVGPREARGRLANALLRDVRLRRQSEPTAPLS